MQNGLVVIPESASTVEKYDTYERENDQRETRLGTQSMPIDVQRSKDAQPWELDVPIQG